MLHRGKGHFICRFVIHHILSRIGDEGFGVKIWDMWHYCCFTCLWFGLFN